MAEEATEFFSVILYLSNLNTNQSLFYIFKDIIKWLWEIIILEIIPSYETTI